MKKRGFTLIELLVVISIIGLLSSVILASLNNAREKARDTQRISEIKQIQLALELYRDDNGSYPVVNDVNWGGAISSSGLHWGTTFATALAPYMATLPVDSINDLTAIIGGTGSFAYYYRADSLGSTYDLITYLESNSPLRCDNGNNWERTVRQYGTDPLTHWCSSAFPSSFFSNTGAIFAISP